MKWIAIISFVVEFNYSLVCVIVYAWHTYIELLNGAHLRGSRSVDYDDDDCGQ